jgi:hypothetical protein
MHPISRLVQTSVAGYSRERTKSEDEAASLETIGQDAQAPVCIRYSTCTPTVGDLGTSRLTRARGWGRGRARLPSFLASERAALGRDRGRLPHHSPSSGQVPCLCLAAREVHART